MEYYIWIIIGVGFIIFFCLWFGTYIAKGVINPTKKSLLETSALEEEKLPGIMKFYQEHLVDEYKIQSRYKYDLTLYYLENDPASKKFIVMSHGHTYTHHGCIKYARMMMEYGYNIVMYDQRYHGASGGKFTSLGWYEKDDLYDVITDTINRFGTDITIGTYGESMGSSTVIQEAAIDDRVKFVFSDCGFTNLEVLVKEILVEKSKILSKIFFPFGKIMFRIFAKVRMSRISPVDALSAIHVPIFFAHGEADNFISFKHTVKLFETYDGPKKLFIAKNNSLHAEGYIKDTKNYEANVSEFCKEFDL